MAYPILAPMDSWYTQGNSGILRSTITEIYIKDIYTPTSPVTAQWDGSAAKDGSITIYVEGTRLTISGNGSGKVQANANSKLMFSAGGDQKDYYTNLNVIDPDALYTGDVETFLGAFQHCGIKNIDWVANMDFSKCRNAQQMFTHCNRLTNVNLQNMTFPVLENSYALFQFASIKSINISNWNMPKVVKFGYIFGWCGSLETVVMRNIKIPLAETMSHFFSDNFMLKSVDMTGLYAPKMINFGAMYNDCAALEVVDVSMLTAEAHAYSQMFERCTKLKKIIGLTNLNTNLADHYQDPNIDSQVAFSEMFSGCEYLTELDLSTIDSSTARKTYNNTMQDMFLGMNRLQKVKFGPKFDWTGGIPNSPPTGAKIPVLPTPNPTYIPGADGNWYDLSGKSYTPEEAIKVVPNTYFASLELARKEPAILENGFMIDIGEGIRNRSGSPVRHRPSEMKAAIEAIPGSSKPEQEKSITIQKNGSYNVIPDSGNTMSKVIVTAQVPGQKPETAGSEIITSNGVHSFSPPAGGVFSNFTADVQIAQPATQEKTVEITTNGTTPVTPDLGKLLSKVIVKTNVSTGGGSVGGGNISSGRILLDSDLVISISSPLVVNHNLGVIPNVFVLFSEYEFRKGEPKHVFFSIVANDTDSGCSIKASYFSGQYPELYLYNGSNGKLSAQSHPNGKSFLDVFGATETQIKIGAYKDVSAAIQGSTKYIWIAAKI